MSLGDEIREAQYAAGAEGWSKQYADAAVYLSHRAELVVSLGPALEPGDRVLDLACGDGALASFLPGLEYLGVDASPEMVGGAPQRRRGGARRPERLRPRGAGRRDVRLPRDLLRPRPRRASSGGSPPTPSGSSSSTSTRGSTGWRTSAPTFAPPGFTRLALRPFFVPQTVVVAAGGRRGATCGGAKRPGGAPGAPLPLHLPMRGNSAGLSGVEMLSQPLRTSIASDVTLSTPTPQSTVSR